MGNKDLRGGFCPGGAVRIHRLLQLIRYKRVDPALIITHRFNGFTAIEAAFRLMEEKPADLIKPAVSILW